jgi:hypothetical protein
VIFHQLDEKLGGFKKLLCSSSPSRISHTDCQSEAAVRHETVSGHCATGEELEGFLKTLICMPCGHDYVGGCQSSLCYGDDVEVTTAFDRTQVPAVWVRSTRLRSSQGITAFRLCKLMTSPKLRRQFVLFAIRHTKCLGRKHPQASMQKACGLVAISSASSQELICRKPQPWGVAVFPFSASGIQPNRSQPPAPNHLCHALCASAPQGSPTLARFVISSAGPGPPLGPLPGM